MSGTKLSFLLFVILGATQLNADYFAGIECDSPSSNLVDLHFGQWEKGTGGRLSWDGAHPRGLFEMSSFEGSFNEKEGALSFNTQRGLKGSLNYNVAKKSGELKFHSMTLQLTCEPITKKAPEILCVEASGKKSELKVQRAGVKEARIVSKDLGNGKSIDAVLDANYENYYHADFLRSKRLQVVKMPGQGRFVYSKPVEKSDVTDGYLKLPDISEDVRKLRCFIDKP